MMKSLVGSMIGNHSRSDVDSRRTALCRSSTPGERKDLTSLIIDPLAQPIGPATSRNTG